MLFIQTRLKYIFVRFLFQWPPGDVILSKKPQLYCSEQSKLAHRKKHIDLQKTKYASFLFLWPHSIINFTTFVKTFLRFVSSM